MNENIVLLHGALGSRKQFTELTDVLSKEFNVFHFDFDGHGGMPINNLYSIDLFVEQTIKFINENEIQRPHIFGYSMGGYVGLRLVQKYPGVIKKVMTLGTKFDWTPEFAEQEVKMLDPGTIQAKVPKFAGYLEKVHTSEHWERVVRQTAQMMQKLGDNPILQEQEIGSIKNEVLIGLGDLDKMVTQEESKKVANILANGTLKIVNNCPHPIEQVNKMELAQLILNFIKP